MMKIIRFLFLGLCFLLHVQLALAVELPSIENVQNQLTEIKNQEQTDEVKADVKFLEETLSFLTQLSKQQADNQSLQTQINNASKDLAIAQKQVEQLKKSQSSIDQLQESFTKLSTETLQKRLSEITPKLQEAQAELAQLNGYISSQSSVPERAQSALAANISRTQNINQILGNDELNDIAKVRYESELAFLRANTEYNQIRLKGNEDLSRLYQVQFEQKTLEQQQYQQEQTALQNTLNNKVLAEKQSQLDSLTASEQGKTKGENTLLDRQTSLSVRIHEEVLKQTAELNSLTQDNVRIQNLLENLQQTQRNFDEQINSLQGTLVLSRIIDKQRQSLTKNDLIEGVSKRIADLRVQIFDISEFRSNFQDIDSYIDELANAENITLTKEERSKLKSALEENGKGISDALKLLNNQLTLLINIDLNQQQIKTITKAIEDKLQEQSFWVQSNTPFGLTWLQNAPNLANFQWREIKKQFDFSNWRENIIEAGGLLIVLLTLMWFIQRKKENIKQRLNRINSQMKTLSSESQWHTPLAFFWTLILSLPSTLTFLTGFVVITYFCFKDPIALWSWGLQMAGYWWYFTFMLALLRPNGIAHRHFKMPKQSSENFHRILKRSAWLVGLLLNARIFINLETGVAYDVIGEVMTMSVLILSVFWIIPEIRSAIVSYRATLNSDQQSSNIFMLSLLSFLLLLSPVALIGLIGFGYYYTSVILIEHFMASYFAFTTWLIMRSIIYRAFEVSARRLAARRLQEKREKIRMKQQAEEELSDEERAFIVEDKDEGMEISQVRTQVLRLVDFTLWIVLVGLLSLVWSDLLAVAGYLDGITLWKQTVTTEMGTVLEAVTLLNLIMAILTLLITYIIVRNLAGLLEVSVFSNLQLSQGTPYTITTLLTYLIIALGSALSFGMLGMSWSKLQWLFAALSVGLGFGMQEIFANFISGIIILFERPVRIGDVITIGEFTGTVSKIRIRATTLVDFDQKEVIVPNKSFVTERITNWALTTSITRVIVSVGVAYGSDLNLVKSLLLQAAYENPKVLKEPAPAAYFFTFGASTLDHELRAYVNEISDRNVTIDALNRRIDELFKENGIEIAFNQLDVFIKNQETGEEVKFGSQNLATTLAK